MGNNLYKLVWKGIMAKIYPLPRLDNCSSTKSSGLNLNFLINSIYKERKIVLIMGYFLDEL